MIESDLIPMRYRDYFQDLRVPVGGKSSYRGSGVETELRWRCRRCGLVIKKNTAGAQSHLAKHLREAGDPHGE